jgi:hypothetical protein
MAKKIAKIDADAMDGLYASEFQRMAGTKVAFDLKDQNGAPEAPQAFKDHKEYLETIQAVLKEDASTDHDPNDPILD